MDGVGAKGGGAPSLAEAVAVVDKLEELLSTVEDGRTSFEIQPGSIQYQVNFDTNFEDRNGFITGIAKYMEEATVHAALNQLLEEGEKHAVMLYTWRCCSRAIPQPKSNDDPSREDIHETTVEILLPEVEKLYNLMKFHKVAIDRFCAEVKVLCHSEKRKEFVSSAYLLTLGKFINMFAILDELKNVKSSVKTDFSTFRRAAMFLKLMGDSQALQESQNLSVFLATPNKIKDNLKENLEKLANYEEVLADVINICVNRFEQRLYVTMDEKHMLVKVIGFCLGLVDNSRCNMYKMDHKKKIRIDKIDRIFKAVEVVPLYGDMQISPFNYIKSSSHYDASKWPNCSTPGTSNSYARVDLAKLLPQISQDHLKYLNELQPYSSMISAETIVPSETENEKISNLALKGLQHLSEWTSVVLELHSWKLLHPIDHQENTECPVDAEEYERATRYNYTEDEKTALVQVIVMIKVLQDLMSKMEAMFSDGIRRDIYLKLQTFVQGSLREPMRKAMKHKKDVLRSVLMSIRDTCAEWIAGSGGGVEAGTLQRKGPVEVKILKRFVGPSSTQLYLVRTMLESLISDKTCAKRALRKDLDHGALPVIEDFHRRTFFWTYLLNFGEILGKCCDLGQMWYREFYLELTMGRRIQFPIEMSMPWILIDHVLSHPSLIEFCLFPLDLYNDSANSALNIFRKQWLFDELIAEVNLCFDQLVYKLSEQIFSYFKRLAAVNLINKKCHHEWTANSSEPLSPPQVIKYEELMKQRRVHLIGHYIDLNKLIRQRVTSDILKSLQAAIAEFEEGDLMGVIQLETLIQVNRETHRLLKTWLPALDDFENLWKEANHTVTAPFGRTTFHILCEVTREIIPDYCYNSSTKRFVKTESVSYSTRKDERVTAPPVLAKYLWGSKQLNSAYSMMFSRTSGFIGEPHFRAVVNLLGYQGLALMVKELIKICEEVINGRIRQWIKVLKDSVLPKFVKAPSSELNDEGTPGLLAYYLQVLSGVIKHPGIKMELFQHFREVGNAVLLCYLLEQSLGQVESLQMCHVAPFQGVKEPVDDTQKNPKEIETLLKALHVSGNITKFGTETQRNLAKDGELLSGELLSLGLKIFPEVLRQIREILIGDGKEEENKKVWIGSPPPNFVMDMHRCSEFHRIWSALQFLCCIPTGSNEMSVEQLFGDSLNWAGCLIIELLGQQKRFETFDFCYHLRESYLDDGKDGEVQGISVQKTIHRIRCIQVLNAGIFSVISRYLKHSEFGPGFYENVRCFLPPAHKSLLFENIPPEMEGQPLNILLAHQLRQKQQDLKTQNSKTEESETSSTAAGGNDIRFEDVVFEQKNPLEDARGDHWDDFKFLEENSVSRGIGSEDEDGKNDQDGGDGEATSSVAVLYQSQQIEETDSVSSVVCGAVGGTGNNTEFS